MAEPSDKKPPRTVRVTRVGSSQPENIKPMSDAGSDAVTSSPTDQGATAPPAGREGVESEVMARLRRLHEETTAAVGKTSGKSAAVAGSATAAPIKPPGAAGVMAGADAAATDREAGLLAMLKIEGEARDAKTPLDLLTLIANAPRRLTRARQIFVAHRVQSAWQIVAVSALPAVDRTSPLIRFIETALQRIAADETIERAIDFQLSAYASADDETANGYPMQEALWVPFADRDEDVFAGMLLTRESAWAEADIVIAKRLGGAFQHALHAIEGGRPLWRRFRPTARTRLLAALATVALGFLPVSLTTLAPVEVVARDPFIVAAPIDGVIDAIPIDPNVRVEQGSLLVKFDDTTLRNKFEVAEREVLVAEARLKTTTQLAFADERGRHDLAVARADFVLKSAERDFARDLLAKTEIRAPQPGLALFHDKKELIGKPVAVGERILEIADPARVELRLDVPVADAIILKDDAGVKVLLDSDPLSAISARIEHSDYQARPSDANVLSFRVVAEISDAQIKPRLGARGSAQIYGDRVPLVFYLLRRPFAKLRQWTGL